MLNTDRFSMTENLKVESDAFENGGKIPVGVTALSVLGGGICYTINGIMN